MVNYAFVNNDHQVPLMIHNDYQWLLMGYGWIDNHYSWFIIYNGSYNVMVDDENEQCGKPNAINLPFGDEISHP